MNGTHRSDGIWIAGGPGAEGLAPPAGLVEAAPWLARAMGLAWNALPGSEGGTGSEDGGLAYDEAEEAMVAERLRALGYLE